MKRYCLNAGSTGGWQLRLWMTEERKAFGLSQSPNNQINLMEVEKNALPSWNDN